MLKYRVLRYRVKNFFRRLKRFISFAPVIWRGHDYDYDYALLLFEYQLKRTADYFESKNLHVDDSQNEYKRIRMLLRLMDKVRNEEYSIAYQEKIEKKYGKDVLKTSIIKVPDRQNTYRIKYEYEDWENSEQVKEDLYSIMIECYARQKKAEDLVWKIIAHNIYKWWD